MRRRCRARTTGARTTGCGPRLCLLDDDGPTSKDPTTELLDGQFRSFVAVRLDEGEAARPSRVAIHRDADAADLDLFGLESLPQFLLGHTVREIPHK